MLWGPTEGPLIMGACCSWGLEASARQAAAVAAAAAEANGAAAAACCVARDVRAAAGLPWAVSAASAAEAADVMGSQLASGIGVAVVVAAAAGASGVCCSGGAAASCCCCSGSRTAEAATKPRHPGATCNLTVSFLSLSLSVSPCLSPQRSNPGGPSTIGGPTASGCPNSCC